MFTPCTQLPGEVWTLVFGQLALSDRLSVRTTCKYFRDLVDNGLLRDRTVELRRSSEEYEERFWDMLRRWRVTSVRLSSHIKWADVARELPGLTTLMISNRYFTERQVQDLLSFSSLQRLQIIHHTIVHLELLSPVLPQRLTHLRVCQFFDSYTLPAEIPLDSPLKKLKSLAFHCFFNSHPVNVIHFLLSSLPQLQHLSLSIGAHTFYEGHISDLPPLHNCSLSSLELLQCVTKRFPLDFMKMLSRLPFLRSLNIFCDCSDYNDDDIDNDEPQKLSAWLRDLPALTSLLVEGADVGGLVGSVHSSVTRLTLLLAYIDSAYLSELSPQFPNLRHLHLEPYRSHLFSDNTLIPRLFPGLRTLSLSHKIISEDAFLSLASLKELEVLETLDEEPPPAALVSKIQALTENRLYIYNSTGRPWLQNCSCASDALADYWA